MSSKEIQERFDNFNQTIFEVESRLWNKKCPKCGRSWDKKDICECGLDRRATCISCAWSVYLVPQDRRQHRKVTARNQSARLFCFYNDKWAVPSTRGIKFWSKRDVIRVNNRRSCNLWTSKNWRAEIKKSKGGRGISTNVKRAVWIRDKGKCVICGSNEHLEFDHIIPHSRGGSNTERNIQLLCSVCNRKKSDNIV